MTTSERESAVVRRLGRQLQRERRRRVEAERTAERALRQLSSRDDPRFLDQLARRLTRAVRDPGYLFGVLYLDLPGFTALREAAGPVVGDRLLAEVARRVCELVRPQDIVAGFGGEGVVLLADYLHDVNDAVRVAVRIQQVLARPIVVEGRELTVGASIGIATSATSYSNAEDILRDAEAAMCRARTRETRFEVFDDAMHRRAVSCVRQEGEVQLALERSEFRVLYQPIVSLLDGRVLGCEALLRWQHPVHGLIGPEYFLRVAEEAGSVRAIGEWILRQTCAQLCEWQHAFPHARALTASVNLSARQLPQPDLPDRVAAILRAQDLTPGTLCLELTENATLEPSSHTAQVLSALKGLGVRLVLDDFGTGYASLSSLHRFPMDALKIDRSFVNQIDQDRESREIVKAIVILAENLKLDVVAEGVESVQQAAFLQGLPCSMAQGYLFSRPVEARAFEVYLANDAFLGPASMWRHGRAPTRRIAATATGRTVLLVDDDDQVLGLLGRWVTEAGMRPVACRTFEEAKRSLGDLAPDVLLTDIRLGDFNGLELVARSNERYPSVSNVVLTAFDDPVLRREAGALKARFLVKPIRRQELLAAVSTRPLES